MATNSNGYTWKADEVISQLIEERGKSKVIFINGMLTNESGFSGQKINVEEAFGLWTINYTPTSFKNFNPIHNESKGGLGNEASNLGDPLGKHLFKPAVDGYRQHWKSRFPNAPFGSQTPDGIFAEGFANDNGEAENYAGFKIAKPLENGVNTLRSLILIECLDLSTNE